MRLRQFTLLDGSENLIRILVGLEITVDIRIVYEIKGLHMIFF